MRDRKKRNIIIGSLCCLLVFMGIGYALLNQRLTIKGQEIIMGEWDVRITNITSKNPVGKAKDVSHSFTNTSATFEADLWLPGDSIEYEVTVENKGNVVAALQTVTPSTVASDNSVKFTHTEIPQILQPGDAKTFTMKVEFLESASSIPSNKDVKYTLDIIYVQNDGKSEVAKATESSDSSCFMISDNGTIVSYDYDCGPNIVVPAKVGNIEVKNVLPLFFASDGIIQTRLDGYDDENSENYQKNVFVFINESKKEKFLDWLDKNYSTLDDYTKEELKSVKENSYIYGSPEYKALSLQIYDISDIANSSNINGQYIISKQSDGTIHFKKCPSNNLAKANIFTTYGTMLYVVDLPFGNYCTTKEACELLKTWFKSKDPANEYATNTYYEYIGNEKMDDEYYRAAYQSLGTYYTIDQLPNNPHLFYPTVFFAPKYLEDSGTSIKSMDFSNAVNITGSFQMLNFSLSMHFINNAYKINNVDKIILPPNVQTIFQIYGFDNVIFPKNSATKVIGIITSSNLLSLNIPASVRSIRNLEAINDSKKEFTSPLKTLSFDKNSKLVAIYGDDLESKEPACYQECFSLDGQSYFSHAKLSSLSLPKSLKYIGKGVFANNSITTLALPDGLKYIDYDVFINNSITSLKLPDGLSYIGDDSFANNSITSLKLPSGLNSIGSGSFENNSITSLNIPNSVEYLGDNAFKNNKISALTFESGSELLYLGSANHLYSGGNVFYGNQLTSVVLPPLIREIGKDSFGNNPNLKQIIITGTEKVKYFDRNANEVVLTDGQQLDVGTKDNPAYATIKYQK